MSWLVLPTRGLAIWPPYCLYCRRPKPKRQGSYGRGRRFCSRQHAWAYYYMEHREHVLAVKNKRFAKDPQRRRDYERARYWAKHDELLAQKRAYWAANRSKINARRQARYRRNKEAG